MQANYRAIFTEMLLAQSAAIGALADGVARCARLAGRESQQALTGLAGTIPPTGGAAEKAPPGGGPEIPGASLPGSATMARALAGLPRFSAMVFLSQYDNLRGRRGVVRD